MLSCTRCLSMALASVRQQTVCKRAQRTAPSEYQPSQAHLHAISAAPPPYTMRLSRTRLRATHSASCRLRFVSSIIWCTAGKGVACTQVERQAQRP